MKNTLTVGERGPSLLEDFHFREKSCTSIMNAFQNVWSMPVALAHMVNFKFMKIYRNTLQPTLTHPEKTTPVFVRFSTVQGSKGSPDTVRDVRGFATKFIQMKVFST